HVQAATGPGVDEYGTPAAIAAYWEDNFVATEPFMGRTVPRDSWDAIRAYVERALRDQRELFEQRVVTKRIRDGHGDLHAANICVEGRRFVLFDCLEFAPRFRCADVAAEVAFLAMDLDYRARGDLARAFVDGYVSASGDQQLTGLLDFYACYRAYVRGKVLSMRLEQPDLRAADAAHVAREARAYFDLARAYTGGRHTIDTREEARWPRWS